MARYCDECGYDITDCEPTAGVRVCPECGREGYGLAECAVPSAGAAVRWAGGLAVWFQAPFWTAAVLLWLASRAWVSEIAALGMLLCGVLLLAGAVIMQGAVLVNELPGRLWTMIRRGRRVFTAAVLVLVIVVDVLAVFAVLVVLVRW